MKTYENENKEKTEKTNTTLSQSKDKTNGKNIKKINTYAKTGENSIDKNKNMFPKSNSKNVVTMTKKPNNLKIDISSRNKGKSPTLYSKINININKSQMSNQQQAKMPLKKIKIADKKNAKLNKTFNNSENNSRNKYVKMKINVNKAKIK